jgi:hypothetical protein
MKFKNNASFMTLLKFYEFMNQGFFFPLFPWYGIMRFLAQNKLAKAVEFTLENTHFEIGVFKNNNNNSRKKLLPLGWAFG